MERKQRWLHRVGHTRGRWFTSIRAVSPDERVETVEPDRDEEEPRDHVEQLERPTKLLVQLE
jgi:hypothetical protein